MAQGISTSHFLQAKDLLALLPWIPSGPVCDIGCGSGYLAAALAAYGLPTTAIDVDPDIVSQARQRFGQQVEWIQSDIRNYRLQRESYAALLCLNVFPFIPNGERARLIGRFKAAVKPGGFLIISGLDAQDALAGTRLAKAANQISVMPTGAFQPQELDERLQDWEIVFSFQGLAPQSYFRETGLHQICQIVARKPCVYQAPAWPQQEPLGLGVSCEDQRQDQWGLTPDFVELIADNYLEASEDTYLARLVQRRPLLLRAEYLSLGTPGLRQDGYLDALKRVIARSGCSWWHATLAFNRSEQRETYSCETVPATEEALETIKENIRELYRQIPVPLVLETPSYLQQFGQVEMEPLTFLRHIAEEADCALSIDVGLFWQQALSQGYEPISWLERLPKERIVHLRIDHESLIQLRTFIEYCLRHCAVKSLTLDPTKDSEQTRNDFERLQELWKKYRP